MGELAVLAVAGIATYALRFLPLHVLAGRPVPMRAERALGAAAPAGLAALCVVAATTHRGAEPAGARAAAIAVTLLVGWRARGMLVPMAAGLAALWSAIGFGALR